jgi:predicted DNA-binding protein with PD1-like motif
MKAAEGKIGRVFILRLEDGDVIPKCLEDFAAGKSVSHAQVVLLGGLSDGQVVVGPRRSQEMPPEPMLLPLDAAHEVVAAGLLVPDELGRPMLHIHGAMGRSGQTITGCLRPGVGTWLVVEAVVTEILGTWVSRQPDAATGFKLLNVPA